VRLRVQGAVTGVYDLRFTVWGSGFYDFRIYGLGFRNKGFGFRV
jgi:hypothetical protein